MEKKYIHSVVRITNNQLMHNGELLLTRSAEDSSWPVEMYRGLHLQYPKFFKMDNLCKVGFLAAELAMKDVGVSPETEKPDFSVLLLNSTSSLDNDISYQQTIADETNYFPSPAVFVYTLANIVTGEIAIRHKIKGETSFYIQEKFSPATLSDVAELEFMPHKGIREMLIGWVDFLEDKCDVLLFRISVNPENSISEWTDEEVSRWYEAGVQKK